MSEMSYASSAYFPIAAISKRTTMKFSARTRRHECQEVIGQAGQPGGTPAQGQSQRGQANPGNSQQGGSSNQQQGNEQQK
jgi:hypothetical protein